MSARIDSIHKPTHFSPPVLELIPLSKGLPMMWIAFWCVWAVYTICTPMVSLEVAADAAEPFGVAVLASAPCVVVAPNNTLKEP